MGLFYGEGSNAWRVGVEGLFPATNDGTAIGLEHVTSTQNRENKPDREAAQV